MIRFVVSLFLLTVARSAVAESVFYQVALPAPQTQYVEIECVLSDLPNETLELKLPVWRPGKYAVLDPAGTLTGFQAQDAEGRALPFFKSDKSTWQISLNGAKTAHVKYRIFANSLGDRTRHVDDSHAFLSGSSVFLYSPELRDRPIRLQVSTPTGWAVATGLPPVPGKKHEYAAENYDILVDSPLEIGKHQVHTFTTKQRAHEIVVWGEAEYDADQLINDFRSIVDYQTDLWGQIPYDRYVFLLHLGPGFRGGTEHINSTIMQATRERLEDPKQYLEFLGLVSHEFFHTWNIKQIRPAGLSPYRYQEENYTTLLWLVEGTTSYYDDLSLVRTGLISVDDYLQRVAKLITSFRQSHGRRVQSLSESSFDAWTKFAHPTSDSPNTTVSFYSKGALASLLLDLFIRRHSTEQRSFDDLLRLLLQQYPQGSAGYTESDLRNHVSHLAGHDANQFFDDFIQGVKPLPFEHELERLGLELRRDPGDDKKDAGREAFLGLKLKGNTVSSVHHEGPAYKAGVIAGDELLAINSRRLSPGSLDERLEMFAPGDVIELSFFRRDKLRVMEIELVKRDSRKWIIQQDENATESQRQRFEDWLKQPWDQGDKEESND